jgi:uncharacterized protein
MPNISRAFIYPIKSCGGIELTGNRDVVVTSEGIKWDRQWMIVEAKLTREGVHRFVTQRTQGMEKLALLTPELDLHNGRLEICSPGFDKFDIPLYPDESRLKVPVKIWGDVSEGLVEIQASRFISDYLDKECLLVRKSAERVLTKRSYPTESRSSFADGGNILAVSEGTVRLIEDLFERQIDVRRFRPNIVIGDCDEGEENDMEELEVESVKLRGVKPCDRCPVVDINPDMGIKDLALLEFLKLARAGFEGKPIVGENMMVLEEGRFRIGDSVGVSRRREDGWARTF